MEEKKIVIVDLGTRKLGVSVATEGDGGKVKVLYYNEFPSAGISHGKVLNPSRLGIALKTALSACEEFLQVKIKEAVVNIQKYDIREISVNSSIQIEQGHCIDAEDIDNLESLIWIEAQNCQNPGEEVFGIVPQSFDADSEMNVNVKDVTGMMAEILYGHYKAYIGKASYRNNIDMAFREAGIETVRTTFSPTETGQCILTSPEMDGGVALMDIGAGASSVSIFTCGTLRHYGAIPFGGDSITGDIVNLCGVDEHLAENIKMGYGGLMPDRLSSLGEKTLKITDTANGNKIEITAKYLSEIITARMREILEALLYEIQQSGYSEKLKNGVVVCGGCANTLNLCSMIKEISGYNARVGAPSVKIFDADMTFFGSAVASSAGIITQSIGCDMKACTEASDDDDVPQVELSLTELFLPTEEEEKGKEEEKEEKKDTLIEKLRRKEEERKRKEEEKRNKEEEKRRKEEEKRREKEEKRLKKEEETKRNGGKSTLGGIFDSISDSLFGSENDHDNEI